MDKLTLKEGQCYVIMYGDTNTLVVQVASIAKCQKLNTPYFTIDSLKIKVEENMKIYRDMIAKLPAELASRVDQKYNVSVLQEGERPAVEMVSCVHPRKEITRKTVELIKK